MTTNEIDFKKFPTTRYQGNKRKVLPMIHNSLKDVKFNTVLDACGGSGSVSYLFKKMGKEVTYNDKLRFNYLIGKAIIENDEITNTEDECRKIIKPVGGQTYKNFIAKTFKDVYYLTKENKWLDIVSTNIISMNGVNKPVSEYKAALAYYALFQSCMIKRPFNLFHRKNLEIRTNDVVRNFGNKKTWERSFDSHFLQFSKEANNLLHFHSLPVVR